MGDKIPKIIHYCWFSGEPLSALALRCIDSWRKVCPEYQIIEWNTSNFDVTSNVFAREAFYAKKWGFVTDYARLKILLTQGGIYMDSDVELLRSFDDLLSHSAFSGFESSYLQTAVMGAEANHPWVSYLLSYYDNRHFLLSDGKLDTTTNPIIITKMTDNRYDILANEVQLIECDDIMLYSSDYFSPMDHATGIKENTDNTHAIHHFDGGWHPKKNQAIYLKIHVLLDTNIIVQHLLNYMVVRKLFILFFNILLVIICYDFWYVLMAGSYMLKLKLKKIFLR